MRPFKGDHLPVSIDGGIFASGKFQKRGNLRNTGNLKESVSIFLGTIELGFTDKEGKEAKAVRHIPSLDREYHYPIPTN